MNDITMLYEVAFLTWSQPNPDRLGTAERAMAKFQVWAINADVAIAEARRIAGAKNLEWIFTVSADTVDTPNGIAVILERILNDPLNPNAVLLGEKLKANTIITE